MMIAITRTLASLVIGTWVATFLGPNKFPGKVLVFALMALPAVAPGDLAAILAPPSNDAAG